jgi:hypothetical protein
MHTDTYNTMYEYDFNGLCKKMADYIVPDMNVAGRVSAEKQSNSKL